MDFVDAQLAGLCGPWHFAQASRLGGVLAFAGISTSDAAGMGNVVGGVCPNVQEEHVEQRFQKTGMDYDACHVGAECSFSVCGCGTVGESSGVFTHVDWRVCGENCRAKIVLIEWTIFAFFVFQLTYAFLQNGQFLRQRPQLIGLFGDYGCQGHANHDQYAYEENEQSVHGAGYA